MDDTENGEGNDNKNEATGAVTNLPYYPTGGFIGALATDRWWIARARIYGNAEKEYQQDIILYPPTYNTESKEYVFQIQENSKYSKPGRYAYFKPGSTAESNADKKDGKNDDEYSNDRYGAFGDIEDYRAYDKAFGFFANCYYDMQTTGMREMSIGMAGGTNAYEPSADFVAARKEWYKDKVNFTFRTYDPDDPQNGGIAYEEDLTAARRGQTVTGGVKTVARFSVKGVTGLYTTTAPAKGILGLTNLTEAVAADPENGIAAKEATPILLGDVTLGDEPNNAWGYETGYYPHLNVFTEVGDDWQDESADESLLAPSAFYVERIGFDGNAYSSQQEINEVLSGGEIISPKRSCPISQSDHANPTMVLRAYRCSQASTAAVILENYNYIMDATGKLYDDLDWACALESNRMTYNDESGYWQVAFKGLNAGVYHFKIQANDDMTYNYGASRFDDGANCSFEVPKDGTDVVIRFRFNPENMFANDFSILVDGYEPGALQETEKGAYTEYSGEHTNLATFGGHRDTLYSLIGSFPESDWGNGETGDIDLRDVDLNTAEAVLTVSPNIDTETEGNPVIPHEFKIRENHDWTVSYGYNGESDNGANMTLKVLRECRLKFSFDKTTHKVTVFIDLSGDGAFTRIDDSARADEIAAYIGESYIADYTLYTYDGFTVISDKKEISQDNQRFSDVPVSGQSAYFASGAMSEDQGVYTYTKDNVPTGKNYQMRIIPYDSVNRMGKDTVNNIFFHVPPKTEGAAETCTVTVTCAKDPEDPQSPADIAVSCRYADGSVSSALLALDVQSYVVAGNEELTGYHWLGSDETKIPDSDGNGVKDEAEIRDYIQKAVEAGTMEQADAVSGQIYTWESGRRLAAGDYSLKIFADGDIDLGVGEHGTKADIAFKLNAPAAVTVKYNADRQAAEISADPPGALEVTRYVVAGTENLLGKVWDMKNEDAVMHFQIATGLYEYILKGNRETGNINDPIPAGRDYAFKVVRWGVDSGSNHSFHLTEPAYIKVTFDPKTGNTEYAAYKDEACTQPYPPKGEAGSALEDVTPQTWSVLGGVGLTGYNWLGLQPENGQPYDDPAVRKQMEQEASAAGKMDAYPPGSGDEAVYYTKTFRNVAVGVNGEVLAYPFKVAANGNWDSGISYGSGADYSGNFIIRLQNSSVEPGGLYYDSCDVTVRFYPNGDAPCDNTENPDAPDYNPDANAYILVSVDPAEHMVYTLDTSDWRWYVVGDSTLVSYDAFKGDDTTYDTVRDITQTIRFTNGADTRQKGIAWELDAEMNRAEGYIGKFAGTADGANPNSGFELKFHVDGKDMTVHYDEDVIDLDTEIDGSASARQLPAEILPTVPESLSGYRLALGEYLDIQALENDWHLGETDSYTQFEDFRITYTSERFMPGKQFLRVETYGIGTNADYNRWKVVRVLYDQLVLRAEDLQKALRALLLSVIPEKYAESSGANDAEKLTDYLRKLKKSGNPAERDQYALYNADFDFVQRADEWQKLHDWLEVLKADNDFRVQFEANAPGAGDETFFCGDVQPLDAPSVRDDVGLVSGSRVLRLIPKGYIEAGNNASVTVLDNKKTDPDQAEESRKNVVIFDAENDTPDVTAQFSDNTKLNTKAFTYYNFAMMMGYAITDKIGLGIYDNYNEQSTTPYAQQNGVTPYDENLARDEDKSENRTENVFYAMTSAYTQREQYTDSTVSYNPGGAENPSGLHRDENGNLLDEHGQKAEWEGNILRINELSPQSLIGDSSEKTLSDEKTARGQTIIKIYKVENKGLANEQEVISTVDPAKWQGERKFERTDAGEYRVKMYWAMNDGRYFTDSKDVSVSINEAGIEKFLLNPADNREVTSSVDEAAVKYDPQTNELTYRLIYTNDVSGQPVTFGILDILPFAGDERIVRAEDTESGFANVHTNLAQGRDISFTLKKISVKREGAGDRDLQAEIRGVYITDDANVRDLLYDDSGAVSEDAAQKLGVLVAPENIEGFGSGGTTDADKANREEYTREMGKIENLENGSFAWTDLMSGSANEQIGRDIVFEPNQSVKAVAVTGIQLASADRITVELTLQAEGEPNDDLFNNAYFWAGFGGQWNEENANMTDVQEEHGFTDPVRTTIVGRELSGNVFLDADTDGTWDSDEAAVAGVTVELVPLTGEDGSVLAGESVAQTVTDATGHYAFTNAQLSEGRYCVRFSAPANPDSDTVHLYEKPDGGTYGGIDTVSFSALRISQTVLPQEDADNNIASAEARDLQNAGSGFIYYIRQEFPSKSDIFSFSFVNEVNTDKEGFTYIKSRQDLGLAQTFGSITLRKIGENGQPLSGIRFQVEYEGGDGMWKPLRYNAYGIIDGNSLSPDVFTTDENGEIELQNLYFTRYRITETETADELNPLVGPIEVELPYDPNTHAAVVSKLDNAREEDGKWLDILITLTNTTKLSDYLPLTGGNEPFPVGAAVIGVALVLIGAAALLAVVFTRKRRQNTNH